MTPETKDQLEKALAACDRWDCIKVLAMAWARMEYLEGQSVLDRSGFQPN